MSGRASGACKLRAMLRWVVLLLSLPAFAEGPLPALNDQEDDNDRIETAFDALCGAVKDGRRDGPIPVKTVAWATACSLRALKL